jgi:hypothetical protein
MAIPATQPLPDGHGVAVWSTDAWRQRALAWADERLGAAGLARTGEVEQPHLRPWATVLRVPTSGGTVWFKASAPGTAFEARLYDVLARAVPDRVLVPLATDPERAWTLLPDGGPPLGARLEGEALCEALVAGLVAYGRLQRDLVPHVDEMLSAGVADMRPAVMPERFDEALAAAGPQADAATRRRLGELGPAVARWCERLEASGVSASLDHNDLHPWNVLGDPAARTIRFYDWGDAVVAHAFAAMLVPLGFVTHLLGVGVDDPRFVRARDAYLAGFTGGGDGAEDLADTLAIACRVAKVARTLTWDRALRAAREQGEDVDDTWTRAPLASLASLLDESYVGGA